MDRCTLFQNLTRLATVIGTVASANMYSGDLMLIEGTTADGRKFQVSLNVNKKEGTKDGN